jgi:WhiB family redox-sensing transcriptional regulator
MTSVSLARSWFHDAACMGPNESAFISEPRESAPQRHDRERRAKAVCARCPVREECLDYALRVREPLGIWGGLTDTERRALLDRAS